MTATAQIASAGARNRESLVDRHEQLASEAKAMVDGTRALVPQPFHLVAAVIAWEAAEADLVVARQRLMDAETARLELVQELKDSREANAGLLAAHRDAVDELATLRLVAKAFTRFIGDVDRASMLVADYIGPRGLNIHHEAASGHPARGD